MQRQEDAGNVLVQTTQYGILLGEGMICTGMAAHPLSLAIWIALGRISLDELQLTDVVLQQC